MYFIGRQKAQLHFISTLTTDYANDDEHDDNNNNNNNMLIYHLISVSQGVIKNVSHHGNQIRFKISDTV